MAAGLVNRVVPAVRVVPAALRGPLSVVEKEMGANLRLPIELWNGMLRVIGPRPIVE